MKKAFAFLILISAFCVSGCRSSDQPTNDSVAAATTPAAQPTAPIATTPTAAPATTPTPIDKASLGRNLLAFGAGAMVIDKTSEAKNSDESARHLIDESGFGWKTADGRIENQSVTLELPARTTLKTIIINTGQPTAYDGRAAKDVVVEVSDESATSGYQTVLEATLKDHPDPRFRTGVDDQMFPVRKEVAGRFVRYTAKNNNGSPAVIFTKEIYGYGEQEPRAAMPNASGTYKIPGFGGDLHLKQEGNTIIGCYQEYEGIVEGTIEGRTMTLVSSNIDSRAKGEKSSFGAANLTDGGKTLSSVWWGWSPTPSAKSYDRLYVGEKISDKIGNCPHMPDLDGPKDVVKDGLEKELAEKGKAILYGINFDFNSDVIRPESKPTLDKVAAILKDKPDWKFSVEGHTDNVGGESYNQGLSDKRAAAVVKYLADAGTAADRLTPKGFGLTKPLAPNNSEAERAQNRRVELVKL